jgi:hypothetical protein
MRCDPRQPLPKLDPKEFEAIVLKTAGAAKKMVDPLLDVVGAALQAQADRLKAEQAWADQYAAEHADAYSKEMEAKGGLPRQDSMGGQSFDDRYKAMISGAKEYEYKYDVAVLNGDVKGQVVAVSGLADILWALTKIAGKTRAEQEKLERVRAEILRNAPNMSRIVRNLTPAELNELRTPPPGPDGRTPNYRFDPPQQGRTPRRGGR